jgi:hypothetical protein
MTLSEAAPMMVQRVTFEPCGEYTICVLDFSGFRDTEIAIAAINEAKRLIAEHPPFSVRVLTDVSGSHMSLPLINAMQEMVRANAPHVTKSAIYGLSLPHRVALRQIRRLTGRDIREFTSRDEAMEYLRS